MPGSTARPTAWAPGTWPGPTWGASTSSATWGRAGSGGWRRRPPSRRRGIPTASPATGPTSGPRSPNRPSRPHSEEQIMAEFPVATSPAPGVMGVDWENRVDFERLRQYRLARVRTILDEFHLGGGALL